MKERLLIPALAGVGFLAALGVGAVRGGLWQSSAAPVQPTALAAQASTPAADAATQPEPEAAEPIPSDPGPDRADADTPPAPTYEDQSAARDRAAAHGARSR
jgi:hypothetical protein